MNQNERKNLLVGSIVYCNRMRHNFKDLKLLVFRRSVAMSKWRPDKS